MSQYVNNDAKGSFFKPAPATFQQSFISDPKYKVANDGTWHWKTPIPGTVSAKDNVRNMIILKFERTLLGCLEMKMDPMLDLIQRTNNRIYDEFGKLDANIRNPAKVAWFGGASEVQKWNIAFGPGGIAQAYRDWMTANIEPQIQIPPQYLTSLWKLIKHGVIEAENLPNVKFDPNDPSKPGADYGDWQGEKKFVDEVERIYSSGPGAYAWEYTFAFSWNPTQVKRQELQPGPLLGSEGLAEEGDREEEECAAPVVAPDVTIGLAGDRFVDCKKGVRRYENAVTVTVPANASKQRFYVKRADSLTGGMGWWIDFVPGFVGGDPKTFDRNNPVDPMTVVKSWSVGTSGSAEPIAKGNGGKDVKIQWKAPDNANGTYVELVYNDNLGQQKWGIVAKSEDSATCMPESCYEDRPELVPNEHADPNDKDTTQCTKYPCSSQVVCRDSSFYSGEGKPRAACHLNQAGIAVPLWYNVEILANSYMTLGVNLLKQKLSECGALMYWEPKHINLPSPDKTWNAYFSFTFTLPMTISAGCVERAIESARDRGPRGLSCEHSKSEWPGSERL